MSMFPYSLREPDRHMQRSLNGYSKTLACYPLSTLGVSQEQNYGSRVILPESVLREVSRIHALWPLMFSAYNYEEAETDLTGSDIKKTHVSVLDFTAEEGLAFAPQWVMDQLGLQPGGLITIDLAALKPGTKVTLKPQSVDFLEISDPKSVLEHSFRNYACLTTGDIFRILYNDTEYAIGVVATEPGRAILTVETDLSVEFEAPVGYTEPQDQPKASSSSQPRGQGAMARMIGYDGIKTKEEKGPVKQKRAGFRLKTSEKTQSKPQSDPPSNPASAFSNEQTSKVEELVGPDGKTIYRPLRLEPNTLFFGYDIAPVKLKDGEEPPKSEPKGFKINQD